MIASVRVFGSGRTGPGATQAAATAVLGAALSVGCGGLPEVEYRTDRLEVATDFDAPICRGTLDGFDDHVDRIEDMLAVGYSNDPIRVYWVSPGEVEDRCGEGRSGCFFPATRVVFTRGASIAHELVHAVLDSEGESYFIEEGMAEMLSGVGVFYDAGEATESPAERLRLSRSEYRNGELDYDAAAHFMRWVYETAGPSSMRRLADEIEARSSADDIVRTLESVLSESMGSIETNYRSRAPRYYPGFGQSGTPQLQWDKLRDGVDVALDCASEFTRGPLLDGSTGQYRVFRVEVPTDGIAHLAVDGPSDAFVELINPHARIRRGWIVDWTLPNAQIDPRSEVVAAGEAIDPTLRDGTYLLVVGVTSTEPVDVTVTMTPPPTRAPDRPATRTAPPPSPTRY